MRYGLRAQRAPILLRTTLTWGLPQCLSLLSVLGLLCSIGKITLPLPNPVRGLEGRTQALAKLEVRGMGTNIKTSWPKNLTLLLKLMYCIGC